MKKLFITGIVIVIFVIYAIFSHNTPSAVAVPTSRSTRSVTNSTNASQGEYKDGSYTGSAADAFYGTIQVKAVVQNGQLADVQFLQFPNDKQESMEINQAAMPQLKQEAIQAQNVKVAVVSGATQTSQAFQASLASALSQAK